MKVSFSCLQVGQFRGHQNDSDEYVAACEATMEAIGERNIADYSC